MGSPGQWTAHPSCVCRPDATTYSRCGAPVSRSDDWRGFSLRRAALDSRTRDDRTERGEMLQTAFARVAAGRRVGTSRTSSARWTDAPIAAVLKRGSCLRRPNPGTTTDGPHSFQARQLRLRSLAVAPRRDHRGGDMGESRRRQLRAGCALVAFLGQRGGDGVLFRARGQGSLRGDLTGRSAGIASSRAVAAERGGRWHGRARCDLPGAVLNGRTRGVESRLGDSLRNRHRVLRHDRPRHLPRWASGHPIPIAPRDC